MTFLIICYGTVYTGVSISELFEYIDYYMTQASPTDNGLLLDEDSMRLDDGVLSPEDSDLAQLRSLNDTELSADWYNFQVILLKKILASKI